TAGLGRGRGADALGDGHRLVASGAPRDDDELLSAVAGHDVAGPDHGGHRPRDTPQHGVPDGMAVDVVDFGEVVEVEDDEAELATASDRGRERRLDRLVEEPAVEQS